MYKTPPPPVFETKIRWKKCFVYTDVYGKLHTKKSSTTLVR